MSTEPSSSTVWLTAASTCSTSVTSHLRASDRRPSLRICSAVASVITSPRAAAACASGPYTSAADSSDSTRMSAMTTSAPARASVSASARPSPREPPVTRATRPLRSISRLTWEKYLPCDHEPLDLRGAFVDLEQLRVAHELLDRVLLDVAVAAEDLDCVGRDLHCHVGCEPLRERRLEGRALAVVEQPGGLPDEEARGLDLGRHVRDHEVDALVHRNRLTELHSRLRVLDRVLVGGLCDPDGAGRGARPREVEGLHRDLEA